jgi:O-antigen/teichoic acid export membrane protein
LTKSKNQLTVQSLALASQLLPAIIGILSFMALVRVTQAEVLGQYLIYTAAVMLFEMIKAGGLQSALIMRVSTNDKALQQRIIGSAYWLSGIASLSISLVLIILFFSGVFSQQPGIQVFCGWYACLGIINVPLNIAEASAVARQDLKFLLYLRLAQTLGGWAIVVYAFFFAGSLESFATVNLVFTTCLVFVVLLMRKTNPLLIKFKAMEEVKNLVKLIKYTMAAQATTNLLKTADTFIIGGMMGPAAVAIYAIPLRLAELFEIPLRSLSTTAFPQLARKHNESDHSGFKYTFIQYLSWAYMLYIPALICAFIFAPYIILIFGGHKYADSTSIFRIFIFLGLFLPANRIIGISLDALQKPGKNLIKIVAMAIINIVGDVVAIKFSNNLNWVAFVSVINAASGALLGWWILKATGLLKSGNIFSEVYANSNSFLKQRLHRVR